jgi:hypothetical protein
LQTWSPPMGRTRSEQNVDSLPVRTYAAA